MSIFSKAEQIAKDIKESATEILTKIFGANALAAFESNIETIFRSDVIVIFEDAITAADSLMIEGQPATGAQKRAAAFEQLGKDLASKGIQLAESAINLGIEMVVGLVKAKTPTPAVAVPSKTT